MKSIELLNELTAITNECIQNAERLSELSAEQLNARPDNGGWTALECIEHLNYYSDFYVEEIFKRMELSKYPASEEFKPGFMGNKFSDSMKYKAKLNTMSTFKNMNPSGKQLDKLVLNQFLEFQQQTLLALKKAKSINLTKTKTGITISSLMKLRLGDTFRVVIYHNQRHIIQALKATGIYKEN